MMLLHVIALKMLNLMLSISKSAATAVLRALKGQAIVEQSVKIGRFALYFR